MVGVHHELRFLGGHGAGDGRLRRNAEARERPLVRRRDSLRRGGRGVYHRRRGALHRPRHRPELHLHVAARAASRDRWLAHDALVFHSEWRDPGRDVMALVALRPARHGARRQRACVRQRGGPQRGRSTHRARRGDPDSRLRVRLHDAGLRFDHGAVGQVGQQPVRRVLLHGELPRRAHDAGNPRDCAAKDDGSV